MTTEKTKMNTTAIVTGVICLLVGLLIGIFVQQYMFGTDCNTPVQLNIPGQNTTTQ